jgi:hypothetical protein
VHDRRACDWMALELQCTRAAISFKRWSRERRCVSLLSTSLTLPLPLAAHICPQLTDPLCEGEKKGNLSKRY